MNSNSRGFARLAGRVGRYNGDAKAFETVLESIFETVFETVLETPHSAGEKVEMAGQSPLSLMHAGRQPMPPRTGRARAVADSSGQRRRWAILTPVAILAVLAAAWCGLWYYAASAAGRTLAGWVAREAAAGRMYSCGSETISGFPFSIQVHCIEAAAADNSSRPPFAAAAKEITFTAPVYHPTVLVGDVTGPLTIAPPGQPPSLAATWSLARITVSGLPPDPDAFSVRLERAQLNHGAGAGAATLFAADDADFDARIVSGSAANHPVIDAVLHFASATAPTLHPLLAAPLTGDIEVVLSGFKDLSPKPFAERFREMQASGGSIEIRSLRLERTDAIVLGAGKLIVNQDGRLDGVIRVAIYGIENIVPQLGIDQLIGQGIERLTGANGSSAHGLSQLDRLVPGLSGVLSAGASASVIDDLKKMGQPTQIDGKPAIALPLRISDGAVYFGMIRVGQVPALF